MRWTGSPFQGASAIPIAPAGDPAAYLSWLLAYQQPLGGPGVVLSPDHHWQFDSLVDLVADETLTPAGTVPLTKWTGFGAVAPDPSVNIQSPLVTGFATFDGVTDSLVASSAGIEDITSSALIVWCARYPAPAGGTMGVVNKRESAGANVGIESGINAAGQSVTTLDYGATSVVLALANNYTAEVPLGVWHWFAMLVDAGNGQCMMASEEEITAWQAIPPGSLSTSTLLSFGAGRLQAQPMDLLCQMAFMGSQVEVLFGNPDEVESETNNPAGPNIRDNICLVLATDTTLAFSVDPAI